MRKWSALFKSDTLQIRYFHRAFPLCMPKAKELINVKYDVSLRSIKKSDKSDKSDSHFKKSISHFRSKKT